MKKILMILALTGLTSGLTVQAQTTDNTDDPRSRFSFGIKAGINYANVWDESGEDFEADPRIGFAGGVFIGIPIGTFLGIQPEVLLSQKGFQGSGRLLGSSYSFSKTTTFLDIPILLQVKPIRFITIVAGPQYSYLLHEKNVYTWGVNSVEQEEEFENDNIRRNILGFVAGIDVNVSHLVVSGRVGFDFQTNHGDGSSSTPRYKNQWLQFTVGFKI